jgi:hypothetical protein
MCPFVLFLLAIVLSVLLRYTDSHCLFDILKPFLTDTYDELGFKIDEAKGRVTVNILSTHDILYIKIYFTVNVLL